MASKRETIMAAVETLLKTVTAGSLLAANVTRTRLAPFTAPDELPAVKIEQGLSDPAELVNGFLDWRLEIKLKVFQKGAIPDKEADAITDSIHSKMMAANALGLIYVMHIVPRESDPDYDYGDQPFVEVNQSFDIFYRTSQGET